MLGRFAVISIAAVVAIAPVAAAGIPNWDAASGFKPDQLSPAWTFGGAQNAVLAGGALRITGRTYYGLGPETIPAFDAADGLDIEARVRYVSGTTQLDSRDAVDLVFTQGAGYGVGFFIGDDRIFLNSGNVQRGATAYVDTHGFHTYRFALSATDAQTHLASIDVFRDGILTLSGSTYYSLPANGTDQSMSFGGGSIYASGVSDWLFVRNTPMVPEPASWALMLAGFGMVGAGIRRQRTEVARAG